MTQSDFWLSVIAGIPSGLLSGWMVSQYFTKREEKVNAERKFQDDKQNFNRFLEALKLEVEFIIESINNKSHFDTNDLKRTLQNIPITLSFKNISEISEKHLQSAHDTINSLAKYIEKMQKEEMDVLKLRQIGFQLVRARINVLMMKRR